MTASDKAQGWTTVITPKTNLLDIDLREIWQYRDLLTIFIWRSLQVRYKQTVLGPLWFFIGPIITVFMYTLVFGNIANISTDGLPQPLFYLSGTALWGYFSVCFGSAAGALVGNAGIYSKVYYPRLINPLAAMVSNLVDFGVEMLLFFALYIYYYFFTSAPIHLTWAALLFPVLVLMLAGMGLGIGLFFSSISTKYRDLNILIGFFFKLWMYATPIIYPLSTVTNAKLHMLMCLNPLTGIIEMFKYGFLGTGYHNPWLLLYSFGFMSVFLVLGTLVFNKAQRNFMDTV
ncbi:MAG: ABC transporter permease [Paludibacteraceae bacterium]|nr:ABC transporter permease [Paludibacteraceae bacterium]MBR1480807.1 ABC transporter permease [Paludibacteraceae bacterium]